MVVDKNSQTVRIMYFRREYGERIKKLQVSNTRGFRDWWIRANVTEALHV